MADSENHTVVVLVVALYQGQDESAPALSGPWAAGLVGPDYRHEHYYGVFC